MNLKKSTKIIHNRRLLGVLLSVFLGPETPLVASAATGMQEGQWKTLIGITIEPSDLPFALPSVKFMTSTCINHKDTVPNTAQEGEKCKTTDYKVIGSTLSWTSRCVDKTSTIEGSGEITYKDKGVRAD
jgi:hypothetical protein